MNESTRLEILQGRNKFMEKMTLFSIVLSIVSNIAAGLPWAFIGVIAVFGSLCYGGLVLLNKNERYIRFVPMYVNIVLALLTLAMIYQDHNFLTYFTVFFNLVLLSFYQDKSTMITGGVLQLLITIVTYIFIGKEVFPEWGIADIVSLGSFIVLFTALFVFQSTFFNKLQIENHVKEQREQKQKQKIQEILSMIKDRVVDEFSYELKRNIDETSQTSGEISRTFTEVVKEINHQFINIENIDYSIDSTGKSVGQATASTKNIRNLVDNSVSSIAMGEEKVNSIFKEAVVVGNIIDESANTMEHLHKESEKIGNIIETIDEIAQKTQYLSINANIEATKHANAGFGVIANEIRKLADDSAASATEISEILKGLRSSVGIASTQTTLGQKALMTTKKRTEETLHVFESINKNINSVVREVEITDIIMEKVEQNTIIAKQQIQNVSQIASGTQEHVQDVLETTETQIQKVKEIEVSFVELEKSLLELYEMANEKEGD
ncbi:methyl-accepting chemotaxis protein [Bacillus cereus group sp. BceL297]|uniref:methyl-accepting chemotaxis protein n=1 Tax=unclassified Bacillus cereus group TaxID=2750818 RepID=UPI003F284177